MRSIKKPTIVWCIAGLVAAILIYRSVNLAMKSQVITINTPVPDEHELFTQDAQSLLDFTGGSKGEKGQPQTNYIYDGKYVIKVIKVIVPPQLTIRSLVKLVHQDANSMNGFYSTSGNPEIKVKYKMSVIDTTSSLNLTYHGNYINEHFENDHYYSFMRIDNFSLNYDKDRTVLKVESHGGIHPLSLYIVKKENAIYTITMISYDGGDDMPETLLYSLIEK